MESKLHQKDENRKLKSWRGKICIQEYTEEKRRYNEFLRERQERQRIEEEIEEFQVQWRSMEMYK